LKAPYHCKKSDITGAPFGAGTPSPEDQQAPQLGGKYQIRSFLSERSTGPLFLMFCCSLIDKKDRTDQRDKKDSTPRQHNTFMLFYGFFLRFPRKA
jgi:hypothetical protein